VGRKPTALTPKSASLCAQTVGLAKEKANRTFEVVLYLSGKCFCRDLASRPSRRLDELRIDPYFVIRVFCTRVSKFEFCPSVAIIFIQHYRFADHRGDGPLIFVWKIV
jgi:hypothetical protein